MVCVAVACRHEAAPPPGGPAGARVDALFSQWNTADSPGCSVGVRRNGALLHERGYGMANLELSVPISPATVFEIASISKPFTAMSIMLLAEQEKLSLDDEVTKYVPEWAGLRHRVTLRHLLGHTSGVRDGFLLMGMAPPREDGLSQNDQMVRVLARTRDVDFPPGTEFQYNNGTYRLLASVVERVSGQRFSDYVAANIFKPLGMTSTHFHQDATALVSNRAAGYHQSGQKHEIPPRANSTGGVGNSGMFSTTGDLLRWLDNFAERRVGSRATLEAMQTPGLPTGWSEKSRYGLGLEVSEHRGARTISHGGGDQGWAAFAVRYPEHALGIVVLCNLDNLGITIGKLATDIADIYLADVLPPTQSPATGPPPEAVTLSAAELTSKAGLYRDQAGESVSRIFVRNGKLRASPGAGDSDENSAELTPVAQNRFVIVGTPIVAEFIHAPAGKPQEVHVTGVGPKPQISIQVAPFTPSTADLARFAGEYASVEVEGTYTVIVRDSGLAIQTPGRSDITLQPLYRDAFAAAVFGVVKFSRAQDASVSGFSAYSPGAKNLRFDRKR
jgi:CubicO group peptidase (beta-lactamase class C family)